MANPTRFAQANCMTEWSYRSGFAYADPFNDIEVDCIITQPSGREQRVPAFYAGDHVWRVRYASSELGTHAFRTECTDASNKDLHAQEGAVEIAAYEGKNPLLKHGPIRASQNGPYLEHEDSTPFLWLGDTWWMGLTKRLRWPIDFQWLVSDRVEKGYSVIQIVAGLYPDMPGFDDRGRNEAGFPWTEGYGAIRPEYFDAADVRMQYLVDKGLVPCIVGMWGYYLEDAGPEVIRKHWRNIIARWGALPVVFCTCGEALMPYYLSPDWGNPEYEERVRPGWTNIMRYIRETDPYGRVLCVHPGGGKDGRDMVDDDDLIDLEWLQTGHADTLSFPPTVSQMRSAVAREPRKALLNSEVAYEGIIGASWQNVQRLMFYSCMLLGACGHTYGANGIWQINSREEPYGPSPHGQSWGETTWDDAARLPGSGQLGIGKRLFERFEWWRFEPQPTWAEPYSSDAAPNAPFVAGIPGEVRVYYIPQFSGLSAVCSIEPDVRYEALYLNPMNGTETPLGDVEPDDAGRWTPPKPTVMQDWILVLKRKGV